MSSSSVQKSYICEHSLKNACCRRSLLLGVLVSRAGVDGGKLTVLLSSNETVEFVKKLIYEFYDRGVKDTEGKSGRRKTLVFTSSAASTLVEKIRSGALDFVSKCPSCHSAYFRGIFLASGRYSDPKKQYSLEFSLPDFSIEYVGRLFTLSGLNPKVARKRSESLLYFRRLDEIEFFFGLSDMNSAVFDLLNAQAEHQIRNGVNRLANCEMNNINKSVSASMKVTRLIERLADAGMITQLPDELQLTARFRLEYKEYSLSRLASAITPPITKSGLIHRLKKIEALAEELLKEK